MVLTENSWLASRIRSLQGYFSGVRGRWEGHILCQARVFKERLPVTPGGCKRRGGVKTASELQPEGADGQSIHNQLLHLCAPFQRKCAANGSEHGKPSCKNGAHTPLHPAPITTFRIRRLWPRGGPGTLALGGAPDFVAVSCAETLRGLGPPGTDISRVRIGCTRGGNFV